MYKMKIKNNVIFFNPGCVVARPGEKKVRAILFGQPVITKENYIILNF